MEAYKQQMFKFLTTPENFHSLLEAVKSFEDVKKQLLTDFWKQTEAALALKTVGSHWKMKISSNVHATHSQLIIYKKSWERQGGGSLMCSLAYENLVGQVFYGLWVNWDEKHPKTVSFREGVKQMKVEDFKTDSHQWWPWWAHTTPNFLNPDSFSEILPHVVAETAEQTAINLLQLGEKYGDELDQIISRS
jgi:hypothetical protein